MKLIHITGIIGILFGITSCYTTGSFSALEIEIMEPALISHEDPNKKIILRFDHKMNQADSLHNSYIFNGNIKMDTLNLDSMVSFFYYQGVLSALRKDPYFDTVYDAGINFPTWDNDSIFILPKKEQQSTRQRYQSNTIYSLADFNLDEYSYIKKANEESVLFPEYLSENGIIIIISAIWTAYRLDPDTSFIVWHRDTASFSALLNTLETDSTILDDRHKLLKKAGGTLGNKLVPYFAPQWVKVQRLYYKSGNLIFKKADDYAKKNEWIKAAEIWKTLIDSRNKNIAAKSRYNLALACEMEGNLDAALDWTIKSFQVFNYQNKSHAQNCIDYIRILSLRKKDIRKLNTQFFNP